MTRIVPWVRDLVILSVCLAAAEFLVPPGPTRPAVRLVIGLALVAAVVEPVISLVASGEGSQPWRADRLDTGAVEVTEDRRFSRVVEAAVEAQAARLFKIAAFSFSASEAGAGPGGVVARARLSWDRLGVLERMNVRIGVERWAGPPGSAGRLSREAARHVADGLAALYGLERGTVVVSVDVAQAAGSPGQGGAAG